ncbi:MAG: hypothetical protein ABI833_20065 [Acidobacteriota bacterium]
MTYLISFLAVCNGLALLLVLILLLRGPFRKFWVVLFYVAWELMATLTLTGLNLLYNDPAQLNNESLKAAMRLYARLYWGNDVIVDLLRFILVIVLTYRSIPEGASRVRTGRVLSGVVAAAILLPFLLFPMGSQTWPKGAWFNSTSELLNFGAAIMNLGLWGTLIANRQRDRQFVSVSIGLGVLVTGTAISYGVKHFAQNSSIPNVFLMLVQLGAWVVWCLAFRPVPVRRVAADKALQSL